MEKKAFSNDLIFVQLDHRVFFLREMRKSEVEKKNKGQKKKNEMTK